MTKVSDRQTAAAVDKIRERFFSDPCYAIFNHFLTKDEHDSKNSIKRVPDLDYLRYIINFWEHGPKLTYVAKSRQLMVSWMLAAYGVWTAIARPNQLILFQSKKLDDTAPIIFEKSPLHARMSFILSQLPDYLRVAKCADGSYVPIPMDQKTFSYACISVPNGSQVLGLAQGAAQVEGRVPSLFISDEASLQDEWQSAMAAAKPALDGDARAICVGTMRLPSAYGEEISTANSANPDSIMRGVAKFLSKNDVPTLRVHYSADPGKDPHTETGAAWLRRQLESGAYPGGRDGWQWQQHMEINPNSRAGTLVLPMFRKIEKDIIIDPFPRYQMDRFSFDAGLDWGVRNNAVLLIFAMSPTGRRYIVEEISAPGGDMGGITGFCRLIKQLPLFVNIEGKIAADPSIWNTDQNTVGGLTSKAQIFANNGVYLTKAKAKGQMADEVFVERLAHYYWIGWDRPNFDPLLQIFSKCTNTITNLPNLMYEEYSEGLQGTRSLKEVIRDLNVDEFDACKYAESMWPDLPQYIVPELPGTFAWRERQYRNQLGADGDGDLWSGAQQI